MIINHKLNRKHRCPNYLHAFGDPPSLMIFLIGLVVKVNGLKIKELFSAPHMKRE